jgi:hypothetical protein
MLRYDYTFLPKGLVNRLMVRQHRLVRDAALAWRNGVVFEWDYTQVLVEIPYTGSAISFRARGPERKELLTLLAMSLDAIHDSFEGLRDKVTKKMPCNCASCQTMIVPHFYDYENLRERWAFGQETVGCNNRPYLSVSVQGLLDGVFSAKRLSRSTAPRAMKAFLSYSKHDIRTLGDFKRHLKPLQRTGMIETWDDSMIRPGENWDSSIRTAIRAAESVFLMVSSHFIATDYIWEEEVMEAMRRHEAEESIVIPIIIGRCAWSHMPFGKLQGLPRKGRVLDDLEGADAVWTEVVEEIGAMIDDFWKHA